MSDVDETTETVETEGASDKEMNFRALTETNKAQEAELEKLRPLRNLKMLQDAGFDPDSDRGVAIAYAIKAGEVEPTAEAIGEFASSKGWEATPVLTETETEQVSSAAQVRQIQTASVSDSPPNDYDEIAEAENAGDYVKALNLSTRRAAEQLLRG